MDQLTALVSKANGFIWGLYCLIPLLCGTGLYFTLRLKFVQPCFQRPYDFHIALMLFLKTDYTSEKQVFRLQNIRIILPLCFKVFKKEKTVAFTDEPLYEKFYSF